jgi:hypothetical protein
MANTTNTGLSISSTSNLSSGQKILIASALVAFEPAAPNPDLIRSERMPMGHKQWDIQTYGRLADASSLTEGVDLAQSQQLFANTVTVTPDEKGVIAQVSKRLIRRQGDSSIVSTTGTLIANSMRRLQDKNVITLYDGFSKSVVGASNTMDITHFRGSVSYLLTDNDTEYGPAPMPLISSLHIEQISDIILDVSDPGAVVSSRFGLSADLLQRWWKGSDRLYGVQIFHGGNIARDSSNDSKGFLGNGDAMAQVMANEAEVTEESDNSLRATEYGIFQEWSEAEIADPHGVEVYSDTTATV